VPCQVGRVLPRGRCSLPRSFSSARRRRRRAAGARAQGRPRRRSRTGRRGRRTGLGSHFRGRAPAPKGRRGRSRSDTPAAAAAALGGWVVRGWRGVVWWWVGWVSVTVGAWRASRARVRLCPRAQAAVGFLRGGIGRREGEGREILARLGQTAVGVGRSSTLEQ